MSKELRQGGRELRVQTTADGARTITGTLTYRTESDGLPFVETVAPGAFADALTPDADVLCLRDHQETILLGRTKSGTLSLRDTDAGLQFTCILPKTNQADDLAASIERGDLDGVSFGFTVPKGGDEWRKKNGVLTRTLTKVNLLEVSPCSWAAYPSNSVSVRSCPAELRTMLQGFAEPDESAVEHWRLKTRLALAERRR